MTERPFIADAREAKGLRDGSISLLVRVVKGPDIVVRHPTVFAWELRDGFFYAIPHSEKVQQQYVTTFPFDGLRSPFGVPGDRLFVQEAWCLGDGERFDAGRKYPPTYRPTSIEYQSDWAEMENDVEWNVPASIPRWASRTLLDVTDVRVVRALEVTEEDAKATGLEAHDDEGVTYYGPLDRGDARADAAFRKLYGEDKWLWLGTVAKVEPHK